MTTGSDDKTTPRATTTRRRIIHYTTVVAAATGAVDPVAAQENTTNTTQNSTSSDDSTDTDTTETNETETNNTESDDSDVNETQSDEDETTNQEEDADATGDEETETDSEDSGNQDSDTGDTDACDGSPEMSTTSVTTPSSKITTEDPAVVEANFRPEPTIPSECTIMVDLEFSFADSGFQWGGGSNWDQSASDLVVGTFEVRPGEVRSLRGELHTQGAEAGDEVTVVADYELWFEGNPEDSIQQTGIRQTISVESPNPPEGEESQDDSEGGSISVETPGFGITAGIASLLSAGAVAKSRLIDDE